VTTGVGCGLDIAGAKAIANAEELRMASSGQTVQPLVQATSLSKLEILAAGTATMWTTFKTPTADAGQSRVIEVEDVANALLPIGQSPTLGSSSARVAIVEFSDFQCPYCGRYAREVLPQIRREFIDTGGVKYVFRHLPLKLHPSAELAAVSAEYARLGDLAF
jgi:protein-disulfide isomerase